MDPFDLQGSASSSMRQTAGKRASAVFADSELRYDDFLTRIDVHQMRMVQLLAMMGGSASDVTKYLQQWSKGDEVALEKLMPLVYRELRKLARSYLRRERPGHTLQATALVHEAFMRLVDQNAVTWQNRAHFFGVAAQMMRRILVTYAVRRRAAKRGGMAQRITLDEAIGIAQHRDINVIALNEALTDLESIDPRQSRVVELRFFGGLSIEETAEVLDLSTVTIKREWSTARLWLRRRMNKGE